MGRQDVGKADGGFFPWGEQHAVFIMRQFCDEFFGHSLLPCQGKPGVHSKVAVIAFGDFEPCQFGDLEINIPPSIRD